VEPTFAAAFPAAAHALVAPDLLDAGLPDTGLPDTLLIAGSDGHHLVRVRRLQRGEAVTAADGQGHWRPYLVRDLDDRALTLTATGPSRTEPVPTPGLAVAFALTKGVKPETVVRQLTELGVDEILPVVATRSIARPRAERAGATASRLERVAREAVMQCRRSRLPRIAAVGPLAALAGHPGLVIAERDDLPPTNPAEPGPGGWLLVVGPEGGLAPEDLDVLDGTLERPVPRLAVGPHVLRAETAAVAAAAVLSARRSGEPSRQVGDHRPRSVAGTVESC
jgi:16S rRNA (uracil1498-N3)-methyltransferase